MAIVTAVVLVCCILIPIMSPNSPHQWVYDDYVLTSEYGDQVSVGGEFELVTINGVSYVHAIGVGEGTINGKIFQIRKAPLDVIYMTGQSNGAYRYADPSGAPNVGLGVAYYFGLEDRYAGYNPNPMMDIDSCQFWSMVDENGQNRVGNKAPALCKEYYGLTGHKVYFVDGAIDSQSISNILPNNPGWDYGKELFSKAMDSIDTSLFDPTVKFYAWIQGESDSNVSQSYYVSAFLTINKAMMDGEFGGYSFKHCFVSQVNFGNSIQALNYISGEYGSVTIATDSAIDFTTSNGLMGPDGLHYSQEGNNVIGTELGQSMGYYENPRGADIIGVGSLLSIVPIILVISVIVAVIGYMVTRRT